MSTSALYQPVGNQRLRPSINAAASPSVISAGASATPARYGSSLYQPTTGAALIVPTTAKSRAVQLIDQMGGSPLNAATNQLVVQSGTKNAAQADRIGQGYDGFDANQKQGKQSLADFTASYLQSEPENKGFADQEIGATTKYYDGTAQSDLNHLADQQRMNAMMASRRGIDMARKQSALWRMQNGSGSYADHAYANDLSNIYYQDALRDGNLRRDNLLYVNDQQMRNNGVRSGLRTNQLNRQLIPQQYGQQLYGQQLQNLSQLGNLDQANTFYSADTPEAVAGRRLDFWNRYFPEQAPAPATGLPTAIQPFNYMYQVPKQPDYMSQMFGPRL